MADVIKTIGSGQGYTTPNNWYTLWVLVSGFGGDNEIGEVHGFVEETVGVAFDSASSSSGQRVILQPTSGNRNIGAYDETKDGIWTDSAATLFSYQAEFVTIQDLVLKQASTDTFSIIVIMAGPSPASTWQRIIRRNVCKAAKFGVLFFVADESAFDAVYRNIFINTTGGGGGDNAPGIEVREFDDKIATTVFNNTIIGFKEGIRGRSNGALATVKNNLVQDSTSADYENTGSFATDANISSDGSSPDGAGFQNKDIGFVAPGSDDYRLAVTDTDAIDAGVDLGSPHDIDVSDFTVSDGNWDIGAYEWRELPSGIVFNKEVIPGVMTRDIKTSLLPGNLS